MTAPTPDPDEVAREIVYEHDGKPSIGEAIATAIRARDEAHRAERERAYREGAEAMREACASVVLDHDRSLSHRAVKALRSLPLPPEGAET